MTASQACAALQGLWSPAPFTARAKRNYTLV